MSVIALIGPHAIGKTTTIYRWAKRYSRLVAKECDHLYGENPLKEIDLSDKVVVLEGSSAQANRWLPGVSQNVVHIISVYCSGPVLLERMVARSKKAFNYDYWDDKKLAYEAKARLDNLLRLRLPKISVTEYLVDKYEDWDKVDLGFRKIFVPINNSLSESIHATV